MYSDTLFKNTLSRRGNMCAQIFAVEFGWSCSFTVKLKSKAHVELSLLFQQKGVPPAIICSVTKDTVQGKFNKKLEVASSHLRQSEPFNPWLNAAER